MNDRQKYQFAGEPERCIVCGAELKTSDVATSAPGIRRFRVWCPNYGQATSSSSPPFSLQKLGDYTGGGFGHEWYSWLSDDPGLAPFLSYSVGDAEPTARAVLYSTIIFVALLAFMILATRVFG